MAGQRTMDKKQLIQHMQGAVAVTASELFKVYKELTVEKYLEAEQLYTERAMPAVKKFISEHPAEFDFALDEFLNYRNNLRGVYKPHQ